MTRFTPAPSIATTSDTEATQSGALSDDFIMIDESRELPLRTRSTHSTDVGDRVVVDLHPLGDRDAFIVSVQPPTLPENGPIRASCDIVLVIDVSGSMSSAAPLPEAEDENEKEATGLSVLDLTKHAARTILETLNAGDRLAIVTFSDEAKVRGLPRSSVIA